MVPNARTDRCCRVVKMHCISRVVFIVEDERLDENDDTAENGPFKVASWNGADGYIGSNDSDLRREGEGRPPPHPNATEPVKFSRGKVSFSFRRLRLLG